MSNAVIAVGKRSNANRRSYHREQKWPKFSGLWLWLIGVSTLKPQNITKKKIQEVNVWLQAGKDGMSIRSIRIMVECKFFFFSCTEM